MKTPGRYHFGSGVNLFTGLLTHIPCCGPQVLMGIWGLKLIGIYSVTVFYQWQFIIPIFISILTTAWFVWLAGRGHRHADGTVHKGTRPRAADIARFFAVDMAIGYAIVLALFLFIPPHDHRVIAGPGQGYVDVQNKIITLSFADGGRWWPWSERYFIAHTDHVLDAGGGEKTFEAKEIPWWRAMFGAKAGDFYANDFTHPVEARLYSRLNPQLLLASISGQSVPLTTQPVKFYLVLQAKDVR